MRKAIFLSLALAAALAAPAKSVLGGIDASRADTDWVGIGTGAYQPGILDYYSDEYPELMPAAVYESASTPGVYRFVPTPPTPGALCVYDIVVHAENPEKVWCENASFFKGYLNFNTCQRVKETSSYDIPANYGKMVDGAITFSTPNSFMVMEMMGYRTSNLEGRFALYMPGKSPADDPVVNDNWEVMGTGKYVEGLLDCEYKAGVAWDVEIERSTDTPGCYRLKPYFEGNPSCPYLPEVADTYVYIHAEDEMEVYTTDFVLLNNSGVGYKIQHRAVSGPGTDYSYYGTLEDGVITFPAESHYAKVIGIPGVDGTLTNLAGSACIVLPGARYYDYFVETVHPTCAKSSGDGFCSFPITLNGGSDVAGIALVVEPGYKSPGDVDLQAYIDAGSQVFPAMFFGFQLNMNFPMAAEQYGTNRWTLISIAVDNRSKARKAAFTTFFTPEKDSDWEPYATAQFADLFVSPSYLGQQDIYFAQVERRKGTTGQLRVVNPYTTHPVLMGTSYLQGCSDHGHYIYINADDPACVYVEESAVGVDCGYGDIVASSAVGSLLNQGLTLDEAKARGVAVGSRQGDEFYFPAHSLFFFETKYRNLMLQECPEGVLLHITDYVDGIEDVTADGDSLAPVEYYDLQGVRVFNPVPGTVVIRKQGASVVKTIVR